MGFFDGFFGQTQGAKQAQNSLAGLRDQYKQMMDQWLAQSGQAQNNANGLFNWNRDYWQGQAASGAPSINGIRQSGEQIMPLDAVRGRLWGRQQNINNAWGRVPSASDVQGTMMTNLDMQMGNINNNSDAVQGQIDTTHAGATGRENDTSGLVRRGIEDSFGSARDLIGGAYGSARKDNAATYADILNRTGNAFRDMKSDVALIKPGGQAQQAQVARSFAPNIANANGRLRRAGIDPNSVQGANVIGNAEVARARAMDDRAASSTNDYVSAMNNVRSGELGATTNAMRDRLGNDIQLGTTEAGMQSNLALGRGQTMNAELLRNLQALTGIDFSRMQGTVGNLENTMNRQNENLGQRTSADILARNMSREDAQSASDLEREANNLDLTDVNLQNQQFQLGTGWNQWDQNTRNNAATQLGGLMNGQYQQSTQGAQLANQFGQVPLNLWNQQLQQENARSGWGTRLLGGLAGSALSAFTGGLVNPNSGGGASARTPSFNASGSSWNTSNPWSSPSTSSLFGNSFETAGGTPGRNVSGSSWNTTNPWSTPTTRQAPATNSMFRNNPYAAMGIR